MLQRCRESSPTGDGMRVRESSVGRNETEIARAQPLWKEQDYFLGNEDCGLSPLLGNSLVNPSNPSRGDCQVMWRSLLSGSSGLECIRDSHHLTYLWPFNLQQAALSTGGGFTPRDIWHCLETSLMVTAGVAMAVLWRLEGVDHGHCPTPHCAQDGPTYQWC